MIERGRSLLLMLMMDMIHMMPCISRLQRLLMLLPESVGINAQLLLTFHSLIMRRLSHSRLSAVLMRHNKCLLWLLQMARAVGTRR